MSLRGLWCLVSRQNLRIELNCTHTQVKSGRLLLPGISWDPAAGRLRGLLWPPLNHPGHRVKHANSILMYFEYSKGGEQGIMLTAPWRGTRCTLGSEVISSWISQAYGFTPLFVKRELWDAHWSPHIQGATSQRPHYAALRLHRVCLARGHPAGDRWIALPDFSLFKLGAGPINLQNMAFITIKVQNITKWSNN